MNGIELIAAERTRQIEKEGWSPEHDDQHCFRELCRAAVAYIEYQDGDLNRFRAPMGWPWDERWWKPCYGDRVRRLVKAGALIAAEIDRLQRKEQSPAGGEKGE